MKTTAQPERRPSISERILKLAVWFARPGLTFPEPTPTQRQLPPTQRELPSFHWKPLQEPIKAARKTRDQSPIKYATWPPSKSETRSQPNHDRDVSAPLAELAPEDRADTPAPWAREPSLPKESGNPISPLYAAALHNTYRVANCQNKPFMDSLAHVSIQRYRRNRKPSSSSSKSQPTAVLVASLICDTDTPFHVRCPPTSASSTLPTLTTPRHSLCLTKGILENVTLTRMTTGQPHPARHPHLYPRTGDLRGYFHTQRHAHKLRAKQLDLRISLRRANRMLVNAFMAQREAYMDREELAASEYAAFMLADKKLLWIGADPANQELKAREEAVLWMVLSSMLGAEWEWDETYEREGKGSGAMCGVKGGFVMKEEDRRKWEEEEKKRIERWREAGWVDKELERIGWIMRKEEGESSKQSGNGGRGKRGGDPAYGELALLDLDDDADDRNEDRDRARGASGRKQRYKKRSGNMGQALAALRKTKGR
ncbi:hypothetical protein K491DRAFT_446845 [Lophiostoma macrostomum CBS 122681]|uniref:Uncharacterized protein n=1 Tax=Lophiostoma macrostomum CBS 122681 TaxID=1314788 RepID=A0A6A6T6X1_9PLEO|nr:hypothetical protein K491DRAFT_446845 [Lophiostoma macrostomum CBS 122681]